MAWQIFGILDKFNLKIGGFAVVILLDGLWIEVLEGETEIVVGILISPVTLELVLIVVDSVIGKSEIFSRMQMSNCPFDRKNPVSEDKKCKIGLTHF